MYIKITPHYSLWGYNVYEGCGKRLLNSYDVWASELGATRAAKKMAKKLNIEYREN